MQEILTLLKKRKIEKDVSNYTNSQIIEKKNDISETSNHLDLFGTGNSLLLCRFVHGHCDILILFLERKKSK